MLLLPLSTLWWRLGGRPRLPGDDPAPRRAADASVPGEPPVEPGGGGGAGDPQTAPGVLEETEEEQAAGFGEGWAVILFNDDVHDMVEVVVAIHLATGFGEQQCIEIMLRAHRSGKAVVTITDQPEAEKVASVLRTHKLTVELRRM